MDLSMGAYALLGAAATLTSKDCPQPEYPDPEVTAIEDAHGETVRFVDETQVETHADLADCSVIESDTFDKLENLV